MPINHAILELPKNNLTNLPVGRYCRRLSERPGVQCDGLIVPLAEQ